MKKINIELIKRELLMTDEQLALFDQAFLTKLEKQAIAKQKQSEPKREGTNRKGSRTTQPIKSLHMVRKIADCFDNPRDKVLYLCGILLGLRISDIVPMTYGVLKNKTKDIKEQKTQKHKTLYIASMLREEVAKLGKELHDDDYVFVSRKAKANGENRANGATHISTEQAWKILKKAAKKARYDGSLSAHALRKTFGYWAYKTWIETNGKNGASLELLQTIFNHDSSRTTLRYIGITQEDINGVYKQMPKIYGF